MFFLSLFLLIFFEVKCVVDRYKWHRPFQMATTVSNGSDRLRKGNLRSRHKARENVHARAMIGFGFTSDWLKN